LSIKDLKTDGFEAALVTDAVKSAGHILVAEGRSRHRRRFSIGHELGHFLIPAHRMSADVPLLCSAEQLRLLDTKDQDRRRQMEAEANRFAALLLLPPPILRAELRKIRQPGLKDIVDLANLFDVSKEAMARAYVEHCGDAVAIVVIKKGKVLRYHRNEKHFPWIDVRYGQPVPEGSLWHEGTRFAGEITEVKDCEPGHWIGPSQIRKVLALTEQILEQVADHALLLLRAEMRDDDDQDFAASSDRWR